MHFYDLSHINDINFNFKYNDLVYELQCTWICFTKLFLFIILLQWFFYTYVSYF